MNCTPPRVEAKSWANTTAISAFWLRINRSASCGVATLPTIVKYSDCARRSTALRVMWSNCEVTTTVRTFFTSVVMANPKMSIIAMGMPNKMSIVRLSRKMWRVSLITNDMNCCITVACLVA